MSTTIEETIYRLSLDGSAYIQGADSLAASTNKFTKSQQEANAKLNQLKENTRLIREEVKNYNKELKENEKRITSAKDTLNLLNKSSLQNKQAIADATAVLKKYADTHNDLKSKISVANIAINDNSRAISKQNAVLKDAEKANTGFVGSLSKMYSGLGKVAQLIPGVGIGGLVAGLAGAVIELAMAETKFEQTAKLLAEGFKANAGGAAEASSQIDILKLKFELARQGFLSKKEVLAEYNDTMGKTVGVTKDFNVAEQSLIDNAAAYIKIVSLKAQAQAIANLRIKESEKALTADLEDQRSFAAKAASTLLLWNPMGDNKAYFEQVEKDKARFAANVKNEANSKIETLSKEEMRVQTELALAQMPFQDKPKKFGDKTKAANKEIVNIYAQELQKLKADIAKLDEKGFTSEATITKAIEEDFKKRSLAFEKAFKNKQLTAEQFADLSQHLESLQKLATEQSIKTFREQKKLYLKQISDVLTAAQFEESTKRIGLLQDSFERERQTIILESEKTINAVKERREKEIAELKKNAAKSGLKLSDISPQLVAIRTSYSDLLDNLDLIREQKLQKLSFDTFERLSEDAKRLLDAGNLGVSQGSLINIQAQTKLLLEGKISFKQYQKELTEIARFEASERFRLEKLFLEQEIKLRQDKLASDKSLTTDQVQRLEDEILRLQQQLVNAEKGNALATGKGEKPDDPKLARLVKYTQALGDLTNQVIGFWQKANDAESEALDRSISLQEKRVTAAQKIAERGNAQYLKAEEDRLTELNVKRENAARKQLGIDAALQASQILVGITGAIAKVATPGIGIAETIGAIAVIVGALATGYGLVKSLQGNQPTFFTGTKDTGRGGNNDSKGGFTATLHPNEAVIPADRNKAYSAAVAAIYDRTVPAEHLNAFVKNYHTIKSVPLPDYSRIKESAELKMGENGRMSVLLSEHSNLLKESNELQRLILRKKGVHAELNIDKNGVGMMVTEYMEQMEINKHI